MLGHPPLYGFDDLLAQVLRVGIHPPMMPDSPTALQGALGASASSPVEVTVPGPEGSPAHDLLREFGFRGRKDRLQMELGEESGVHRAGLEQYGTTPYLAT